MHYCSELVTNKKKDDTLYTVPEFLRWHCSHPHHLSQRRVSADHESSHEEQQDLYTTKEWITRGTALYLQDGKEMHSTGGKGGLFIPQCKCIVSRVPNRVSIHYRSIEAATAVCPHYRNYLLEDALPDRLGAVVSTTNLAIVLICDCHALAVASYRSV